MFCFRFLLYHEAVEQLQLLMCCTVPAAAISTCIRVPEMRRSAGQKLAHVPFWCVSISCFSWREGLVLQRR